MSEDKLRKAVWQFVVEHSREIDQGYACMFGYSDRKNLFARIAARSMGYSREDGEWRQKAKRELAELGMWRYRAKKLARLKKRNPFVHWIAKQSFALGFWLIRDKTTK